MIILVDHNLKGYVVLLQGSLAAEGWLDLLSIRFVMLEEAGLAVDSNDRLIWQFAQANQMLLLRDLQEIKYTTSKNDNHYKGGEVLGCRWQPNTSPNTHEKSALSWLD